MESFGFFFKSMTSIRAAFGRDTHGMKLAR